MPTTLNVIRGTQRTHTFYCANLEYGEIANLVVLPEDFLGERLFDQEETMQRKLSWPRVNGPMKDYLLKNDDAFFSSLTLFIVPRDESPLEEGEGYDFKPFKDDDPSAGILTLRSTVVLFPADGQHRAAAIKLVLKECPQLASHHIPVVLVPYKRKPVVRQMFSDLNLNAKPVSKTVGYALETRDPLTLLAKGVAKAVPLFGDRVNYNSNSLPESSIHVITFNTLRAGSEKLCKDGLGLDFSSVGQGTVPSQESEIVDLWNLIIDSFPQWKAVFEKSGTAKAGALRQEFVFPHGIGWQAIAHAVAIMVAEERGAGRDPAKKIRKVLKAIDWRRTNPDFQSVAMVGDRVNNTGPGIRSLAGYILWKAGYQDFPAASSLIDAFRKAAPQVVKHAKAVA
jgi:DNA sulfur modification protein DndB